MTEATHLIVSQNRLTRSGWESGLRDYWTCDCYI